ncbi:hypothetical protein HHJ78_03510 [Mobiluncus mulieris]|uniref:Uncharacterized protein n=1 Tax=Mobiluncus mulieris TaxID=2052 RepID=A0A7Y0U1B5_9ACTO|nr:hypothetical protein [Mobiluncus mulieris]NMW64618.1 hypothetical protein [Mobiluncus mulieris]
MDFLDVISVVGSIAAVLGAAFSWWYANLSRKARVEAERSADQAERTVEGIEAIAESLRKPPLEAVWNGSMVTLINRSKLPLEDLELVNRDAFARIDFEDGISLAPGESVDVLIACRFGARPAQISVRTGGVVYGIVIPSGV